VFDIDDRACIRTRARDVTVVIPTRNESGNIAPIVRRLDAALGTLDAEILFVDDSDDDTPERVTEYGMRSGHPVLLVHRTSADRDGGLGTAVLAGLRDSSARWAVVMDGDLQHPPEAVPHLIATGDEAHADVVIASRYVGSGSAHGLGSTTRSWVSGSATRLAKAVFPRRLRGCSDPMSGFFAVRLDAVQLDRLHPNGFKILLEVLARSSRLRLAEYPYTFQDRLSGQSKASWREGVLFVRRLMSLRLASVFGRHSQRVGTVAGFAAVGATGIAVNSAGLWIAVGLLGAPLLLGAALATQLSTVWNFVLADRLVFAGAKHRRWWLRLLGFAVINNAVLVARLPLLSWLVHDAGVDYVLANVATLVAAFGVRFVISDRCLFTRRSSMTVVSSQTSRSGPVDLTVDLRDSAAPRVRCRDQAMPWRYDIHGIVTIGSIVRLKELDSFSTDVDGPVDISIQRGHFGNAHFRSRARVTQYAAFPAVSYEEHLGRLGSDFHVDMTDGVKVVVGPLLVRSPHVLYTNVVEALLRFILVSRGYMLLHSACLELDGHGVLISALTDTGKTGTILRLLRENPSRFLSDDMTIVDANGKALCYPKPLTISQHTLRSVNAGDLTAREWRRLRIQSRLHSKEGRSIGARLGEMNVPIMSLNALTQFAVPPPKYAVDRLVPCMHTTSVHIEQLFIIERDQFRLSPIEPSGLVDELIANTDDAYGFPPFRYFAPALVVGGSAYEELRAQERSILSSAILGVRARRLATPDFTWADHIPQLTRSSSTARADDRVVERLLQQHAAVAESG
jgi:putative flippase GtrA